MEECLGCFCILCQADCDGCCEVISCDGDCCDCDCSFFNVFCCWICMENTNLSAGTGHVPTNAHASNNLQQPPVISGYAPVVTQPPQNSNKDSRGQNDDTEYSGGDSVPLSASDVIIADADFPKEPPPSYEQAISRQ